MPDQRSHRGPHPEDHRWFNHETMPVLQKATSDLNWLLERGYAGKAALTLVGDRYSLTERQRMAVYRSACAPSTVSLRCQKEAALEPPIAVDGFNLLITVEAALSGGVLLLGCDGCVRDLASMHGSYRRVEETDQAIGILKNALPPEAVWYLDQPVSNSGRLAARLRDAGWTVELVANPDRVLAESEAVAISTDRYILDRCKRWHNLGARVVERLGVPVWDFRLGSRMQTDGPYRTSP